MVHKQSAKLLPIGILVANLSRHGQIGVMERTGRPLAASRSLACSSGCHFISSDKISVGETIRINKIAHLAMPEQFLQRTPTNALTSYEKGRAVLNQPDNKRGNYMTRMTGSRLIIEPFITHQIYKPTSNRFLVRSSAIYNS